jgi:hypothetical protein
MAVSTVESLGVRRARSLASKSAECAEDPRAGDRCKLAGSDRVGAGDHDLSLACAPATPGVIRESDSGEALGGRIGRARSVNALPIPPVPPVTITQRSQSVMSPCPQSFLLGAPWALICGVRSASIIKGNRAVFNIKGNDYRLVVKINYQHRVVYVRFVGTHAEYDKVNVEKV